MLNLLRADVYKLRHSKTFSICLVLTALFVIYIVIDFHSSAHIKEQLSPSTFHWIYMFFEEKMFLPYFIPVFQAVFITMFITGEYNSGTIRDAVALGYSRWKIYLSKLLTAAIASLSFLLIAVVFIAVTALFVFGRYGSFSLYDLGVMGRMFVVQSLLYTAYASLFLMLAFLIRNTGGTMAFSIFFSLIMGSLSTIISGTAIENFFLFTHFPPTATPNPQTSEVVTAVIVALAYLIVCSVVGGGHFKKQDIK